MVSFRHQFVLNLSWLEACFPVSLSNSLQVVCMLRREPRTWAPAFLSAAPVSLANAHACPRIDSVSRRSRSRPEVGWIMPVSPSLMRSSRPLGEAASLEERQGLRYSNRGRADTRVGFGFSCAKLVRLSASVEMDEVDCKRTCVWEQGSVLMRMTVRATTWPRSLGNAIPSSRICLIRYFTCPVETECAPPFLAESRALGVFGRFSSFYLVLEKIPYQEQQLKPCFWNDVRF